jgi:NAD(P)-dependent dehydrogenase (short-subunit alcohol dehydrogenase family)
LTGADEKACEAAVAQLKSEGLDRVDYHQCDVSDDASVARCMSEVEKKAGRIDILVNYAGDKSDSHKPSLSLSIADVSRSFATNALSAVKISRSHHYMPMHGPCYSLLLFLLDNIQQWPHYQA